MPNLSTGFSIGNSGLGYSTQSTTGNSAAGLSTLSSSGVDPGLQVSTTATSRSSSGATWDDFEVVGTKIYDPNGQEFIVKGINMNGPGMGWGGSTPRDVDEVKKWGFNAIRLNCRELGFELKTRYSSNGTIDEIVRNYTSQGIVVMIDAHENIGDWFTPSELKKLIDWETSLARKYKDNPYVWINISNEPGAHDSGSSAAIQNYLNQNITAIQAIRATGFDNPIVVDGWFWGQDKGKWDGDVVSTSRSAILSQGQKVLAADPLKNTLFSIHAYDQWQFNTKATLDNFIDRVHDKGLALVVGEYGAEAGGTLRNTVTGLLASTQQHEIGRFAWAWLGWDAYDLTTSGKGSGALANFNANGAMPNNLTWYGQQVWQDNHRTESLQRRSGSAASLPPPTTANGIRFEAENLNLSTYKVESSPNASGGQQISLLRSGQTTGTASGIFSGTAGLYDVTVRYVDETDGASNATVSVAGRSAQIRFDQASSRDVAIEKTLFSGIRVQPGDRFQIAATANQSEWARFDWIQFTPVA